MSANRWTAAILFLFVAAGLGASAGCGKKGDKAKDQVAKAEDGKRVQPKHSADGWWCTPHGIPEHLCSLCDDEVAEKLRKEGDWCKIHDRAQSQCFKCDPSKYKKFEDMYVAKYGEKPKRPPESEFTK